jgi:hypothetical protein
MAATGLSIMEQRNQAEYANDVAEMNAEMANRANMENYRLQNRQLNLQEAQENEQLATETLAQQLETRKAIATQRVASAEAGVSGLSIDSIFADIARQGANNITTMQRNAADSQQQREADRKALQNSTWAGTQVNTTYKGSNSLLGAGLQIASAGAQTYMGAGGTLPSFGGTSKMGGAGNIKVKSGK